MHPVRCGRWLDTLSFVRSERLGPTVAARISAYGSLALYEGYAADGRSPLRSLAGQLNGLASLPRATDDSPTHSPGPSRRNAASVSRIAPATAGRFGNSRWPENPTT